MAPAERGPSGYCRCDNKGILFPYLESAARGMIVLAKLTSKNQLTLPKAVTAAVEGTEYFDVTTENGRIVLTPVRVNRADGVRAKLAELGLSETDVKNAVAWGPVGRMTLVRPVLDTNVLVSALLFHSGALSWLRGAWRSGRIRPLAGQQTTAELNPHPRLSEIRAERPGAAGPPRRLSSLLRDRRRAGASADNPHVPRPFRPAISGARACRAC